MWSPGNRRRGSDEIGQSVAVPTRGEEIESPDVCSPIAVLGLHAQRCGIFGDFKLTDECIGQADYSLTANGEEVRYVDACN